MHSNTSWFCADTEYNSTEVANLWLASHMQLFAQFHAGHNQNAK